MNEALLPDLGHKHPMFWASQAVNLHTLHTAMNGVVQASKSSDFVTLLALVTGASRIEADVQKRFENARKAGVLLHAWHGSTSLAAESVEVAA